MPLKTEDMLVPHAYLRDAENELRRCLRMRLYATGEDIEDYSRMVAFWNGSVRFWKGLLSAQAAIVKGPNQGVEA